MMDADRYKRVKELFQAVTNLPADQHAPYLDKECDGDGELRREVDSLLEHHYRSTQLLEDPAPDLRASKLTRTPPEEMDGEGEQDPSIASFQQGRFTPGTLVATRYRIVELLGKGGMGEVYRADDLTLNQSVALKFLPPIFSGNPRWLARFHNEVRFARQVAHPNVCRVFDIGSFAGEQFISMEYIDGEDLASLLRRIGRLPQDKCIQIARQLCSGLAAAHEKGLLHRDLKPANVMIDGRGHVRITDFGLAAPADQVHGKELRAGTPAYMSPEQLLGREITVRSDIYSLGLVLYEIFTGKQTFEANSFSEYVRMHHHTPPQSPAVYFNQIDPTIETVILRCLEKEPSRRFSSAIAVAAALPGGDPLAAAMAAGETPSPEMVAAAGGTSGLKAPLAMALLAIVGVALLAIFLLSSKSDFLNRVDLVSNPPVVLEHDARELIHAMNYPDGALDTASGYAVDYDFYQHVQENLSRKEVTSRTWDELAKGPPGPVYFWYRQSPRYLVSPTAQPVGEFDPPMTIADMVRVELTPEGKLLELEVIPPADVPPGEAVVSGETPGTQAAQAVPNVAVKAVSWSPLIKSALGMSDEDFARAYVPAAPRMTPFEYADVHVAWVRRDSDDSNLPVRIEAAGFQGRPTFFKTEHDWPMHPKGENNYDLLASSNLLNNAMARSLLILVMLVAALFMAYRNLASGRADRSGALRLALFFATTGMVAWVLRAHHVPVFLQEFYLFRQALGDVLYPSLLVWAYYMALEPYVRRIWPETMISWSRILSGRVLDPLIGRHAVIGSVAGVICILIFQLEKIFPPALGLSNPLPVLFRRVDMLSVSPFATVLTYIHNSLYVALLQLLLLVVLRTVLRKRLIAGIVFVLLVATLESGTTLTPGAYVAWGMNLLIGVIYLVLLQRFGLVSLVSCLFFFLMLSSIPLTPNLSAWYSNISLYAVAATGALAAAGAYVAIASRSTFRPPGMTKTNA